MTLILLEALGALVLLVFIVWWTMFSGRNKGELPDAPPHAEPGEGPQAGGGSSSCTTGAPKTGAGSPGDS